MSKKKAIECAGSRHARWSTGSQFEGDGPRPICSRMYSAHSRRERVESVGGSSLSCAPITSRTCFTIEALLSSIAWAKGSVDGSGVLRSSPLPPGSRHAPS
jgi:hypothetical protein